MSWDMYDMTQKVQVVVVAIVLPLVAAGYSCSESVARLGRRRTIAASEKNHEGLGMEYR